MCNEARRAECRRAIDPEPHLCDPESYWALDNETRERYLLAGFFGIGYGRGAH